ncbi:MAG: hypothetical protein HWD58_15760 [Bacteroidota bacterium]|nr:MAG: hypothetical protein HWD58_15760 [Bacteroidota bacterium]
MQVGTYNGISNSGDGYHYGVQNVLTTAGTGPTYGITNSINVTNSLNNSLHFGMNNLLFNNGPGNITGANAILTNTGTGNEYGFSVYHQPSSTGEGYMPGSPILMFHRVAAPTMDITMKLAAPGMENVLGCIVK